MKILYLSVIALISSFFILNAQPQDNNFQRFYGQVQAVISKNVESLQQEDLNVLRDAIRITPDYFGAANQQIVGKLIQDAKNKYNEYNNYVRTKEDLKQTKAELDETSDAWKQSEARGDSLYSENVQLKALIDQLTERVNKLDKEAKNLQTINRRYHQENLQAKEMLESGKNAFKRIFSLLPSNSHKNEMFDGIPVSLQDSINQSECQIAELLKANFVLTLDGLSKDVHFMDSARVFFTENRVHLNIIESYLTAGSDIITKLKSISTPCTMNYAAEIEITIQDFKSKIESSADLSQSNSFMTFVSENSGIVITLVIIILFLIVLFYIKGKKK